MHVAVTAIGADRPGIVAAVSRVLTEHGANIEDSRMAILGGHFAMVLIVDLPGGDVASLEAALAVPARELALQVSARAVSEAPASIAHGVPYVVSVYGADRPGIVWRVAELLARHHVNIADLATHAAGGVYVMILEVVVPAGADAAAIEQQLRARAEELGVDASMRPMDPETL